MKHYEAADLRILDARRRRILARLSVLSEAPAARLSHERRGPMTAGSKAPAGVDHRTLKPREDRLDLGHGEYVHMPELRQPERAPDKDRSMFDHYKWRFTKAGADPHQTAVICAQAERDYAHHVRLKPANETTGVRDERILRDYAGVPSWEVATWEDCNPAHVDRLRRMHLMDKMGNPDSSLSERDREIIVSVRDEGLTLREAADRFDVSKSRVGQVLAGV